MPDEKTGQFQILRFLDTCRVLAQAIRQRTTFRRILGQAALASPFRDRLSNIDRFLKRSIRVGDGQQLVRREISAIVDCIDTRA